MNEAMSQILKSMLVTPNFKDEEAIKNIKATVVSPLIKLLELGTEKEPLELWLLKKVVKDYHTDKSTYPLKDLIKIFPDPGPGELELVKELELTHPVPIPIFNPVLNNYCAELQRQIMYAGIQESVKDLGDGQLSYQKAKIDISKVFTDISNCYYMAHQTMGTHDSESTWVQENGYISNCMIPGATQVRINKGGLYTLGGSTGTGKTTLTMLEAMGQVKKGKNILYFTLEEEVQEMKRNLDIMMLNEVNEDKGLELITSTALFNATQEQKDEMEKYLNNRLIPLFNKKYPNIGTYAIQAVDPTVSLESLPEKIQDARVKYGGIDIVYVDYVTLLPTSHRAKSKMEVETHKIDKLKFIASVEQIAIFIVAQVNREGSKSADSSERAGKKHSYRVSDLAWSSQTEKTSTAIILFSTESQGGSQRIINVGVHKNRTGNLSFNQTFIFDFETKMKVEKLEGVIDSIPEDEEVHYDI